MAQLKDEEYLGSSDEAPEEETLQESRKRSQAILSSRREADRSAKNALKEQRRKRDEQYKIQSKNALSQLLEAARATEAEQEGEQNKLQSEEAKTVQLVKKPRKRRFETEKDGFKVKVIGSRRSQPVAAKASELLARREAFFNRKSIPRK